MKYKDSYFDSGKEYNSKRGVYSLREMSFLKSYVKRKSDEHYKLILLEKWKNLKGCKKVLDAGCGRGQFMKLNPYRVEIEGIDILANEVNQAKEQGLKVQVADLNKKIPFKDNSFDGIISSHVMEHLEDPSNMLNEFRRVLKTGGRVVIAVPNFSFRKFHADYTHRRFYPPEALYRILTDYGFKDIKIRYGPFLNQFLSAITLPFPRIRHGLEVFLGKFKPWEFIAIGVK